MKKHQILDNPDDISRLLVEKKLKLTTPQRKHLYTFFPGTLKAEHDASLRGEERAILRHEGLSLKGGTAYVLAAAQHGKARRVTQLPGERLDIKHVTSVELSLSTWELSYWLAKLKPYGSAPSLLKTREAFSISGCTGRHVPGRFVCGNFFHIRKHARKNIAFINCDLCTLLDVKLMEQFFSGLEKAKNKLADTFVIAITGQANKRYHEDRELKKPEKDRKKFIMPDQYYKFDKAIERATNYRVIFSDTVQYRDEALMATYHAICTKV